MCAWRCTPSNPPAPPTRVPSRPLHPRRPGRCGNLPFVFEPGMCFERYVDYVLDVPMYFVYRDSTYHNVAGQSFRDFMQGRLPGLPGGWLVKGWVAWVGREGLRKGGGHV